MIHLTYKKLNILGTIIIGKEKRTTCETKHYTIVAKYSSNIKY